MVNRGVVPLAVAALATLLVAACQSRDDRAASGGASASGPRIEARDSRGVIAHVIAGHPCRATVEGVELLVGGRPLVAQLGAVRWTGVDEPNGTTLRKNDQSVARIHANQLFDAEGVPLMRLMPNGDIVNGAGQITRRAQASTSGITIGDITVTGTNDVAIAAMLTAREAEPEIRALAACHYLLSDAVTPAPTASDTAQVP